MVITRAMRGAKATIALLTILLPLFALGQTADFNFASPNGFFCNPQVVVFTQNCSGTPDGFIWRFGNGASGTAATESVVYTVPGTYNVTLTAVYPSGAVSVTKTVVINPTPGISVAADRNYICQPGVINFTATGSPFVSSYEWDFGDGSPLMVTGINTTGHSFSAYGNYTVTVRALTTAGCWAAASIPVQVMKFPIVNPIVNPMEGCIPANTAFSASVTLPTGDAVTNFAWDFGDGSPVGNTAVGTAPHTYTIVTPITTASVTITTAQGCTNQYSFPAFAFGTPPFNTTAVTQDGRTTYCASEIIGFNGTAVNANRYVWDFGDGTTQTTTSTSISYRYRTLGPVRVTLTPYFNGCAGATAFIDLIIEGVVADYTLSNQCSARNNFTYNNLSLGNVSSFSWTFSDIPGSPDITNYNTTHTFPAVGSFTTKLYVYDAITGCSDSLITDQYTATPAISRSTPAVCKDSMITYSVANTYPPASGYTYEFHVGGTVVNAGINSSTPFVPTTHGVFNDFVIISGPATGTCDDTLYLTPGTRVQGPVLDFSVPPSACLVNNSFAVTNNSAPFFAGDNIIKWEWTFGDGARDSVQFPAPHSFSFPANYWVALQVTDINNCAQKDSVIITVYPAPQIAVFPKIDTLCAGQSMNLYAFTADTLLWTTNYNINCVTCDTVLVNPLVTIAYVAQATNAYNCVNTDTSFIRVYAPFTLQVSPADTSICPGGRVQYNSNVNGIFTWSPVSFLSSSTVSNPFSLPDSSITYTIIASDSAGCYADTTTASITIYAVPTVDAGPDQVIPYNDPFTLSPVYSPDVASYLWSPATNGLSCTDCPVVTGVATVSTTYLIEVTNENSCKASDEIRVIVACNKANLNLPSAFTPNNDGLNDQFYPLTRGYRIINRFIVFDRWGNKVFERYNFSPNTPSLGWDGDTKDKQTSGTAAFVWIIEATCDAGEKVQSKGTVTVIR
ncbi:MAG TPA: PKD domain-containing protein [Chitinophagaceae bacterium]|nr:PKD domain-containing protein [Chitinophagaceae bacterium]